MSSVVYALLTFLHSSRIFCQPTNFAVVSSDWKCAWCAGVMDDLVMPWGEEYGIEIILVSPVIGKQWIPSLSFIDFFFQGSVSLPRNNPLIFWPGSRKWVFYSCIYYIITHKIYMSSYAHFPFKPNEIVLCSLSYSLIFIDLNNKLQTFSHVNKFSYRNL